MLMGPSPILPQGRAAGELGHARPQHASQSRTVSAHLALPTRSSRTMTTTTPAGPMFF